MRNIFLQNSCRKCGGETIPDSFIKNQKSLNFYTFCLCFLSSCGLSKYIETKLQTTWFYCIQRFLKKQKEDWNQPPIFIFCMIFLKKYFSCSILLTDRISLCGCLYFMRYWTTGYKLVTDCDVINFEINLIFLIEPLFSHDQNVKTKT